MTTFADINNFEWSTIVQDQPERKQDYTTIPVAEQTEQIWFDKFLNDDQVMSAAESGAPTTTGSPLEFSSLFDVQDREAVESESLFSSNVTSLDNSPMIKSEESLQNVPKLDLSSVTRNTSTVSMASMSSMDSSESTSPATTGATAPKKPKKKRAPRKRLTPHQKQAHNKIEKRYRININAKIAGLQQIIPWVAAEKTAFETGDGQKPDEEPDVPRLNKSMILEKATSYIIHLQEEEKSMKEKLEKLKQEVERLGGDASAF